VVRQRPPLRVARSPVERAFPHSACTRVAAHAASPVSAAEAGSRPTRGVLRASSRIVKLPASAVHLPGASRRLGSVRTVAEAALGDRSAVWLTTEERPRCAVPCAGTRPGQPAIERSENAPDTAREAPLRATGASRRSRRRRARRLARAANPASSAPSRPAPLPPWLLRPLTASSAWRCRPSGPRSCSVARWP
jgi:hypothetical protein